MEIFKTKLPGVLVFSPLRIGDSRGFFSEVWNRKTLADHGIGIDFVQDNHSLSTAAGTIRGLHFQTPPHAQTKLVRCARGRLFDVAVDIRKGSPTYGQWVGEDLSFQNVIKQLIPTGFLHGFITRVPNTEIIYKCSDYFAPECDGAIRFDDPDIGIDWELPEEPQISVKDRTASFLAAFDSPFTFGDST